MRSLIACDQRRIYNPLDPAIKLLDRDIQKRKAGEVPLILLRPRYKSQASLLRKLGGKRSSPPPSREKLYPARRQLHKPSTGSLFQPTGPSTQNFRRLVRNVHRHPLVGQSFRPFDKRGVAAAIRKMGSSTGLGSDGLTMVHLHHLGEHGLAFLTELFNLSLAAVDILAIQKNSVTIPILKAGKPCDQGRSYRPISFCLAVKILERLLLKTIVEVLSTLPIQQGFKPSHSTTSTLLPFSARVVSTPILTSVSP